MSAVTLPLSRVKPCANRVDHHRGECDLLIERVLADALVKLDWEMNRGLAAARSAVERTGHQERRQQPSRPPLCLLRTPSMAQSLVFPYSGSS